VQAERWGGGPYPPRTIVEVRRLNQDDIAEVEGTFFVPAAKRRGRPEEDNRQPNKPHRNK
jgi:hypothetical protein